MEDSLKLFCELDEKIAEINTINRSHKKIPTKEMVTYANDILHIVKKIIKDHHVETVENILKTGITVDVRVKGHTFADIYPLFKQHVALIETLFQYRGRTEELQKAAARIKKIHFKNEPAVRDAMLGSVLRLLETIEQILSPIMYKDRFKHVVPFIRKCYHQKIKLEFASLQKAS